MQDVTDNPADGKVDSTDPTPRPPDAPATPQPTATADGDNPVTPRRPRGEPTTPPSAPPNWAQVTQAVCGCVTAIAAIVGFGMLWWQAERDSGRRTDDALTKLYAADIDFHKFLGSDPAVHGLFFPSEEEQLWKDEKAWREHVKANLKPEATLRLRAACQMLANLVECYLLLEDSLSSTTRAHMSKAWRWYAAWVYERNPYFRDYMKQTRPTWTEKLNAFFDEERVRLRL